MHGACIKNIGILYVKDFVHHLVLKENEIY